ncbi:histidine kinase [Halobacteriales archaeon QH_10_67_13]|nr:MAG: histidine kinase [Halobacteriales archaeon QH_10_67_13]
MDTRKVQQLGPSTLAMTLPAKWADEYGVEKGDEVSLRHGPGTLTVVPESVRTEDSEAMIDADGFDVPALERAIVAQYVLGRRIIHIEASEPLTSEQINAVYDAQTRLMGLGVIEETPTSIAIRCSVDPADFTLDNLLERLESTGSTMRAEAVEAIATANTNLADRALNRERQANKIFMLLLRLIFTAYRNPTLAQSVGLEDGFPLLGYRSIAKNLELIADDAEDIAEVAAESNSLGIDEETIGQIRTYTDRVDEMSELAVTAAVTRNHDTAAGVRERFTGIESRGRDILAGLPEMDNETLLRVRSVLVGLDETAQYAVRNAEIATNLALDQDSEHITIS